MMVEYIYIYMYIYIHTHTHPYICIYGIKEGIFMDQILDRGRLGCLEHNFDKEAGPPCQSSLAGRSKCD